MTDKEKQRELIVEIMKADENSGLYDEPVRKNTAVDWLAYKVCHLNISAKEVYKFLILFEQAKQMEKQHIKEAHLNGQSEWDIKALEDINKKLAEQYYKETYGE